MGDTKSSDAITPESLATTRSGTLSKASARMRAPQVRSYEAATWSRYGGGWGGENDLPIVARHDGRELGHEVGTPLGTVILDHDAAVLEIVDLELARDGLGVDAPRRDVWHVRPRGGRIRVVRRDGLAEGLDVVD